MKDAPKEVANRDGRIYGVRSQAQVFIKSHLIVNVFKKILCSIDSLLNCRWRWKEKMAMSVQGIDLKNETRAFSLIMQGK